MTYTLTFSKKVDGKRQILTIESVEAKLSVEADDRTGAIHHADTLAFCAEHECSVGRVYP